jgi:ABC-2 type transport system permease protein
VSLGHALRAEWTKHWTLQATGWLTIAVAVGTAGLGTLVAWSIRTSACATPTSCGYDLTRMSLAGVYLSQIAVVTLACLAVTNEYDTGLIRATLTADPRRTAVYAAKTAVVTASVLAAGLSGVLGAVLAGRSILPGNGFTSANGYPQLSLGDGPTLRAAGGTVLYLELIALLSLGVGLVVRHTAAALAVVLAVLYATPIIAQLVPDPHARELILKYSPMTAGLAIQATKGLDHLPIGPWAGLGVLTAYAAGAVILGGVMFTLRDA